MLCLLAGCGNDTAPAPDAVSTFNIDRDRITVSGLSSGAYMAGQLHVAHSALIGGAALIAGGPYACAGGSLQKALGPCVEGGEVDVAALIARARERAAAGQIDPLENLADDRVWVFHGGADTAIDRSVSVAAADFYRGVTADPPALVAFVDSVDAVHGMPTLDTGLPCGEFGAPFINACGFDAAGALLEHLYGPLDPPGTPSAALETLSQAPFADAGLRGSAYVYAPPECRDGASCGLHVAFHGCRQSDEFVGDAFATGAGYNAWAETNRLVVLYPQASSSGAAPLNPLGCWDWWGYTGERYATRAGPQVAAIRALIERLAGPR